MTLKQIRDTIISTIGPDTELQVADLNIFINEGYMNVVSKILDERKDFFPDTESISVTTGDVNITPTKTWSSITLIQVDFNDGAGYQTLKKDTLENVLGPNSTDERGSMIFCLWGSDIYVPNFNKAFTMRIYGYIIPADLSADDDVPLFSRLLHNLLITWGVGRAVETSSAAENFLDGSRKRQEFWDSLEQLLPSIILKDSTNVKSLI